MDREEEPPSAAEAQAEAGPLSSEARDTCTICCEGYNEAFHTRSVLTCGHDVCVTCLVRLERLARYGKSGGEGPAREGNISCPMCRQDVTVQNREEVKARVAPTALQCGAECAIPAIFTVEAAEAEAAAVASALSAAALATEASQRRKHTALRVTKKCVPATLALAVLGLLTYLIKRMLL